MVSVAPVEAIVPQVQEVNFLIGVCESALNITVYHTPVTSLHHVDAIEVEVAGSIVTSNVDQSSTTFIVQPTIGEIPGTTPIRVRAHCTVNGWSSWSETIQMPESSFDTFQIPEFPSWIFLPLFFTVTFVVVIIRKRRAKGP